MDKHPASESQTCEPEGPPSRRRIDHRTLPADAGSTKQVTDGATPTTGEVPDNVDTERGLALDDDAADEGGATPTMDDTTDAPPAPDFSS